MDAPKYHGIDLQSAIDAARAIKGIVVHSISPDVKNYTVAKGSDWGYWSDYSCNNVRQWETKVWPPEAGESEE